MNQHANLPEAAGVSSKAVLAYLDALAQSGQEIHGIVVLMGGKVACDIAFAPYDNTHPHMLFSLSKSFTSAAVGFAVAEGKLQYEALVSVLLADKLPPEPSPQLRKLTVEHLLCMASGLDPASDAAPQTHDDWARHILSFSFVQEPGSTFHYNSMNTFLLSQIVQRVTGQKVADYLQPRLFAPLGIAPPCWEENPEGITAGGWGLNLSTHDIAKFGQLLLQKGVWQGKQVLPPGWVELASRKHVDTQSPSPDWAQGYGYQFWRCRGSFFRGDGMHGQLCLVIDEKETVIAVTAGLDDMGLEMELIHRHLLPALDGLATSEADQAALQERIAGLHYPWPAAEMAPVGLDAFVGTYQSENGHITALQRENEDMQAAFTAKLAGFQFPLSVTFAAGRPYKGRIDVPLGGNPGVTYLAAYGISSDGCLHTVLRAPGTPYVRKSTLRKLDADTLEESVTGTGFETYTARYRRQSPCKQR